MTQTLIPEIEKMEKKHLQGEIDLLIESTNKLLIEMVDISSIDSLKETLNSLKLLNSAAKGLLHLNKTKKTNWKIHATKTTYKNVQKLNVRAIGISLRRENGKIIEATTNKINLFEQIIPVILSEEGIDSVTQEKQPQK